MFGDIKEDIKAARKVEQKARRTYYKVANVLDVLKEVRLRVEYDFTLHEAWTRFGLSGIQPQLKKWFAKSPWADQHYPTDEEVAELQAEVDRLKKIADIVAADIQALEDQQREHVSPPAPGCDCPLCKPEENPSFS